MSESRTDAALKRIENALARIETRAAQQPSGELVSLRRRHDELRNAVNASLSELDTLIAEMER